MSEKVKSIESDEAENLDTARDFDEALLAEGVDIEVCDSEGDPVENSQADGDAMTAEVDIAEDVLNPDHVKIESAADGIPVAQATRNSDLLMPVVDIDDDFDDYLPLESAKDLKKKKRKKIFLWSLIPLTIALILGAWFAYGALMGDSYIEVEPIVLDVFKSDFNKTITEAGALRPITSTLVAAPVSGTVEELYVAEGDTVKKGDKLFLIENPELNEAVYAAQDVVNSAATGVTQAQNAAYAAQARVNEAVAKDVDLRAAYDVATEEAQRKALYDEIVAVNAGIPDLRSAVTQAWASVDEANATLTTANRALQRATAERDNRLVTAPAAGVIVGLSINRGSVVVAGENVPTGEGSAESGDASAAQSSVLEIADMSAMMVRTAIDEMDIVSVEEGQNVRIALEALPDVELSGKVTRIAPKSKSQSDNPYIYEESSSVTFNVDVRIDDLDPRLRIGMTGEVIIEVVALTDVIVIPSDAIMYEGADTFVMVRVGELATERRKVKIGETGDFEVVVTEGLEEGDRIELPNFGTPDSAPEMMRSTIAVG